MTRKQRFHFRASALALLAAACASPVSVVPGGAGGATALGGAAGPAGSGGVGAVAGASGDAGGSASGGAGGGAGRLDGAIGGADASTSAMRAADGSTVDARVVEAGGTGGPADTSRPVVGTGASSLRGDGVILWDNVPVFPNGIFYNGRNRTPAQIDSDVDTIATAGFNAIEASQLMGWSDVGRFLATCQQRGLRVSAELWANQAAAQAFVEKWKSHPALWAWDVADDSHRRFTVAQVRDMNAKVKSWDPKHLSAQTVYDPAVMGPFMDLTDMVWPYRYPVYNKAEGSSVGVVSWIMNAARTYKTPLVGIPQAYLWGDNADDRYPSAAEYRNMIWQYVIGGARGLLPYSFTDSGLLPAVAPVLWTTMIKVNAELTSFTTFFRLGTYAGPSAVDENVKTAFWRLGPVCLVAMENHRTFVGAVSAAVPAGCTGSRLVGAGAQAITRNNGNLVGSLAALQVRVFTMEP